MYLSKKFQLHFFCLDYLCDALWEHLNMVRIYTKKPGCPPDFEDPIILKRGSDVRKVCFTLHRDLPDEFKYALVWVSYRDFIPFLISYLLNISFFVVRLFSTRNFLTFYYSQAGVSTRNIKILNRPLYLLRVVIFSLFDMVV